MSRERPAITGSMVRHARQARGIMAKDLAVKLGIAASYLSEIETGRRTLTDRIAEQAGHILDITPGVEMPPECQEPDSQYHSKIRNPPAADYENLASQLISRMPHSEFFAMIHEFATAAENGDTAAITLARDALALMEKLSREKGP